jgi:branched-chain amino acid aminotransferase
MLVCDYYDGEWHAPHIVPFGNLVASPSMLALHYGQTVFEGMKAFRMEDGSINIFRMEKHYDRFVRSLERMCMAVVPKEIFVEGLSRLLNLMKHGSLQNPVQHCTCVHLFLQVKQNLV